MKTLSVFTLETLSVFRLEKLIRTLKSLLELTRTLGWDDHQQNETFNNIKVRFEFETRFNWRRTLVEATKLLETKTKAGV